MQSKGSAPNSSQKKWRDEVRTLGCIISKDKGLVEIHHVLGATAKHNKESIGHEFILPLSPWFHRENPSLNVTDYKRRFEANFGTQIQLFRELLDLYVFHYEKPVPISEEKLAAIFALEQKAVCI